jgi:hypothetical protein
MRRNVWRPGLALLLLCYAGFAQSGSGTVCVASRADDPFRGQVIPPTGEVNSNGLPVGID